MNVFSNFRNDLIQLDAKKEHDNMLKMVLKGGKQDLLLDSCSDDLMNISSPKVNNLLIIAYQFFTVCE